MNYQKLIVAGNATADPEKKTSKDKKVAYTRFSVGVGEGKNTTTFFPIVVFGEYGETVAEFVRKGSQILIEGRARVSEKGRFSVVADRVVFGSSA